jgi:hypothetical protein
LIKPIQPSSLIGAPPQNRSESITVVLILNETVRSHPVRKETGGENLLEAQGRASAGIRLAVFTIERFVLRGESMIERNLKLKLLFAVCSLALVLIPLSGYAQDGIWSGAKHGVEKGAQGVQKGAESVGHETKKVITGQDDQTKTQSQDQTTTQEQQNNARMKGGTQGGTQTETSTSTTEKSERGQTKQTGEKEGKPLPRTAGELPLLALAGCLALAGAGAFRLIRREN